MRRQKQRGDIVNTRQRKSTSVRMVGERNEFTSVRGANELRSRQRKSKIFARPTRGGTRVLGLVFRQARPYKHRPARGSFPLSLVNFTLRGRGDGDNGRRRRVNNGGHDPLAKYLIKIAKGALKAVAVVCVVGIAPTHRSVINEE